MVIFKIFYYNVKVKEVIVFFYGEFMNVGNIFDFVIDGDYFFNIFLGFWIYVILEYIYIVKIYLMKDE